ncbi:MAG: primosomal protein N' [Pirellulales bacterium]
MSDSRQPELFPQDLPPWEIDAGHECLAASIVFAEAPYGPFHYRIPDALAGTIHAGMRVRVPLGKSNRPVVGYCIAVEIINTAPSLLKEILEAIDGSPLCNGNVLKLIQWMSKYYLVPLGQVFEAVIPAGVRSAAGVRIRTMLYPGPLSEEADRVQRLPAKQKAVLEQLQEVGTGVTIDQLQKLASCSAGPIQALRQAGFIEAKQEECMDSSASTVQHRPSMMPPALSVDQRQAMVAIQNAIENGQHQTILLHGVTGSGKTEVYMQAIAQTIANGRQAIVLVPEISLTPQTRTRFQDRFGNVAVLHSHMSDVERHHQWRRIVDGEVPVVIGPRSAIFAPLPHLGLIILDEEHENSFKQETIPRYHARDVAIHRAFLERIPLILGSATPSLETYQRAQQGRYKLIQLPRRIHNRPLPTVRTIDLRLASHEPNRGAISRELAEAMQQTFQAGGQTMLLLNRRGFATSIQCPHCGFVVACPDCDLPLTHHHDGSKAVCHYCDYTIPTPSMCPQCKFADIKYAGTGTQRLEFEIKRRFPSAQVARMDSDTMKKPGSHERTLHDFRQGKIHILLGTQMIAKGLDFPNVLLVGVINADTALHFPDFRASEKTFQIVTQVAGRTGRGEKAGQVLVQTFSPEHPAIMTATKHDYLAFATQELEHRSKFGYPPFGSLARMILRGPHAESTEAYAGSVVKSMQHLRPTIAEEVRILGPAPPPIAKLRGLYRFHIMLAAPDPAPLNRLLSRMVADMKPPEGIQFVIDIDPIEML